MFDGTNLAGFAALLAPLTALVVVASKWIGGRHPLKRAADLTKAAEGIAPGVPARVLIERLRNDILVTHYANILGWEAVLLRALTAISYIAGIGLLGLGIFEQALFMQSLAEAGQIPTLDPDYLINGAFQWGFWLVVATLPLEVARNILVNSVRYRRRVIRNIGVVTL